MRKLFVQIGLLESFEMAYLAAASKSEFHQHYLAQMDNPLGVPNEFTLPRRIMDYLGYEPLHVVGVDMNPRSIEMQRALFDENPNISFVCAAVWDRDIDAHEHNGWTLEENSENIIEAWRGERFTTRCVTLQKLFSEILASQDVPSEIVGVQLDVEFTENVILEAYDWSIKPILMMLEDHYACRGDTEAERVSRRMQEILISQGYRVYSSDGRHFKFVRFP